MNVPVAAAAPAVPWAGPGPMNAVLLGKPLRSPPRDLIGDARPLFRCGPLCNSVVMVVAHLINAAIFHVKKMDVTRIVVVGVFVVVVVFPEANNLDR